MSKAPFNTLVLGGGGREHALAWKISTSPMNGDLYIAPGNGGTREVGTNVNLDPMKFDDVGDFCIEHAIDFLVVGPEAPLVAGIADYFSKVEKLRGTYCIGPSRGAAMLEGSKAFAKEFMARHNIPTAKYREFTAATAIEAHTYIAMQTAPIVLKADGLAAGKGVVICSSHSEAVATFDEMVAGKFGAAGAKVVIEEFLHGIEFSVFAITDGSDYLLLPVAKDYKRIGEGDTGLNTGGMGSVSPPPFVDDALMEKVTRRIVQPTIAGIRDESMQYRGFVFFGLISVDGDPYVIEYNCRMGDPETEVVMPRLQTDLLVIFEAMRDGNLSETRVSIDSSFATTVMCVSGGYPGHYSKGKLMNLPEVADHEMLFHAGTKREDGGLFTSGGRVIAATAMADSLAGALAKSNTLAEKIDFDGKYFRSDIGFDL